MVRLGAYLASDDEYLLAVMKRTEFNNGWLTVENCQRAAQAISTHFLQKNQLENWVAQYDLSEPTDPKTVGLVLAGNIPLVGFHDVLSVFIAGHRSAIKLSDKDRFLLPHLLDILKKWEPAAASYFTVVEKLTNFDAVIATGSNNSARYFEQYFSKYPHIIRRNRNAIAVLTGAETMAELYALGNDIFAYYGLGCRNVSKVYLPNNYDFEPLLEALHAYNQLVLNTKYKNNFDYNYAMYLLNNVPYHANGCIILVEEPAITSRIATLHYEHYADLRQVEGELIMHRDEIQCVVGATSISEIPSVPFGKAQQPGLTDYADGVDTMAFLKNL